MSINYDIVGKIAFTLLTLVIGKYLDRWFTKRPRLISYLGHTSAFNLQGPNPINVHTHAIVVRNAGRESAINVRIGHNVLPENYQLYPAVPHSVERTGNGITEIVIPRLVANEQVTISYLYFPPIIWNQINAYTKSDEGFAKIIDIIPTPKPAKWFIIVVNTLIVIGLISAIYAIIELIKYFLS